MPITLAEASVGRATRSHRKLSTLSAVAHSLLTNSLLMTAYHRVLAVQQ